ncbi:MAG: phosphatidate cytidylyltransferase [Oscillospiraceae bacterium]|nr:phosphatidate cytidylyltransferase [Oscillospiraceae bacterium]
MKVRIITAAVGVPVLLALILFAPLWGMGIAIGALCAVAAWELMRCSLGETPKRIYVSAILCAFCLPMMFSFGLQMTAGVGALLFLFFVLSLELMISFNGKRRITLEMVAVSMLAGAVLPLMLSTLIRIARVEDAGRVRVLVPLIVAFSSDAGAYFVGMKWGRRKLAPEISPHKTLEGSLGGIVSSTALSAVYGLILMARGYGVNLLTLAGFGLFGSLVSQLGDLTFSAFKRQYGIKDYSNLLPGHGGVLDRFDSMYYLAPLAELWMFWLPVIWR